MPNSPTQLPYRDPTLTPAARAADLLSRMTLPEKVGQLNQRFCGWNAYRIVEGQIVLFPDFAEELGCCQAGAVYGMHRTDAIVNGAKGDPSPAEGARAINHIQRLAMEHSRHSIPLLVSEETPKGYYAPGATTFPSPIAYGSSWNRDLLREMGRIIAAEVRAGGGHLAYGPILDICTDPRWSRIEETFGEDPYLAGELGAAMVRGMQGDSVAAPDAVISTLKHFVAYGASEGGRNTAPAHMGQRELREIHLAPFRAAVRAGALSLMASYNDIDGIPVAADPALLTDVLRGEWGFDGFVVADALAIDELCQGNSENRKHRVAPTLADAAALALSAGLDLSLWDQAYTHLLDAVRQGKLSEAIIDRAVRRILRIKFLLGLFEHPFVDEERAAAVIGAPEHRALALEVSRQSIILLKNTSGVLPLPKTARIAVIGPNAHNLANLCGTYVPPPLPAQGTTIYQGLQMLAASPANISYALGCRIKDPSRGGFAAAIAAARQADVIVAAVGGSSAQDRTVQLNAAGQTDIDSAATPSDIDCGENVDRASIGLSGVQEDLLRELAALGKPLIVVLVQGRPHDMRFLNEHADAVLCGWYPGPDGGRAIAEIIFGDTNPSAKLTLSLPKELGQIPVNYNHKAAAEKRYLFQDNQPLYTFGHGLSYTTFACSNLQIRPGHPGSPRDVHVCVTVSNTGRREGTEVVQLYVRDEYASVTRPVLALKDFTRVTLAAGEQRHVEFTLNEDAFSLWNARMQEVVEPGTFTILVGGSSQETLAATYEVTERTAEIT